jgi:alpha-L-fucosidase
VGPTAAGIIPAEQRHRLLALGTWLGINGAAIYGTRPWKTAEGRTVDGIPIRFTQRDDVLYAILLGTPPERVVGIEDLTAEPGTAIRLLGQDTAAAWEHQNGNLMVTLPDVSLDAPAHTLRIAPR